jgi:hypothetical protein
MGVGDLLHPVGQYGYLAVFFGVTLESAGVPLPGETVLLASRTRRIRSVRLTRAIGQPHVRPGRLPPGGLRRPADRPAVQRGRRPLDQAERPSLVPPVSGHRHRPRANARAPTRIRPLLRVPQPHHRSKLRLNVPDAYRDRDTSMALPLQTSLLYATSGHP